MKILKIVFLFGLLAAPCCFAQTSTPAPTTPATEPSAAPTGNQGGELMQKLKQMTPEERREFLKNHPVIRERLIARLMHKLESMTPEQRQEFLQNHPWIREFLKKHPKLEQKLDQGSQAK